MAYVANKDSDKPGHPQSDVFAVRMKKAWIISYPLSAQRRLWSDWADAQADLSVHWVLRSFCWFCYEAAHLSNKHMQNFSKDAVKLLKIRTSDKITVIILKFD